MLTINRVVTPSPEQWAFVVEEMRNSWESWERGDSDIRAGALFDFGPADAALCRRLLAAGPDHAKFARMLPLHLTITAPNYWWREMDTYRVGVAADDIAQNSTSQMHTIGREPFRVEMFSLEDVDDFDRHYLIGTLERFRQRWLDAGRRKGPEAEAWRALLQHIPDSWNYRRGVSLNYQAARAIYGARRAHRLREWRQFCAALETLPQAWLITEAL